MEKSYIYMACNKRNGVLYVGTATHLPTTVTTLKKGGGHRFASKYGCDKIVWYKGFSVHDDALEWAATLSGWHRIQKLALVEQQNPYRDDLGTQILDGKVFLS